MPPVSRATFLKNKAVYIIIGVLALATLISLAFWFGRSVGYDAGYAQAQTDATALQEEVARKAAEAAAKSANPFQAVNPLEGVEANPFEKVKKVLNPFEN